jgi:hypothetical protein
MEKSFDQFQGEPGPDHLSAKAKNIHVIVFDVLMGGELIVYQLGTYARDFVCADRCADRSAESAAAEGHADNQCAAVPYTFQLPAIKGRVVCLPWRIKGAKARWSGASAMAVSCNVAKFTIVFSA